MCRLRLFRSNSIKVKVQVCAHNIPCAHSYSREEGLSLSHGHVQKDIGLHDHVSLACRRARSGAWDKLRRRLGTRKLSAHGFPLEVCMSMICKYKQKDQSSMPNLLAYIPPTWLLPFCLVPAKGYRDGDLDKFIYLGNLGLVRWLGTSL